MHAFFVTLRTSAIRRAPQVTPNELAQSSQHWETMGKVNGGRDFLPPGKLRPPSCVGREHSRRSPVQHLDARNELAMRRSSPVLTIAAFLALAYVPRVSSAAPASMTPSVGAVTSGSAPASAPSSSTLGQYKPTKPAALVHFEAGNRLYKSGLNTARPFPARVRDLRAAVQEYEAGALVEDAPAFDYNLGHAARVLVDNRAAVAHLQRFLERAHPDEPLRSAIENEISDLDPAGDIRMQLRQADAHAQEPTPASVARPTPVASLTTSATKPAQPELRAPVAKPGRAWSWAGWGLIAAGVAGGGGATWLAVSATGLDADAKDTTRSITDRVDLQNRADSRRRSAVFVGVGSGAAIVLGVIILAIPARPASSASATAWNLGISGNGVSVFGRF